jgi:hypothetical protein
MPFNLSESFHFCNFDSLLQLFIPIEINTTPFQNPRSDPIAPTATISEYEEWFGWTSAEILLIVGATHVASKTRKKTIGIRIYCLNDTWDCLECLWLRMTGEEDA